MSYNSNFFNNFRQNVTFQNYPQNFVPPPPPLPYFNPLLLPPVSDQDFVKTFEKPVAQTVKTKSNISINKMKTTLHMLVTKLNEVKEKGKTLKENLKTMSDNEWTAAFEELKQNKAVINDILSKINDKYLDVLRKALVKRSAKRLRLKRLREDRKKEKEMWIKDREEKSRKIDENLQKIKDEIEKAKQEEEKKLLADAVLREVLRKKHDAKKFLAKLEALLKLYRARQNTAKGRGEVTSEANAEVFRSNIDKLKRVWTHKLNLYEEEEGKLRAALESDENEKEITETETQAQDRLNKWRDLLFGGAEGPQANFQGDIEAFIAVRSQWDQFIDAEGSTLPIGWVVPNLT